MALTDVVRDWWLTALLVQGPSAHPTFGHGIRVSVDGDTVTLTGTVNSAEEVEEVERELREIDTVTNIANRLTVDGERDAFHLQTVLALFPDSKSAELTRRTIATWTLHDHAEPEWYESRDDAEGHLRSAATSARIEEKDLRDYLEAIDQRKALVMARVPEDDAIRLIAALEGTGAEMIRTLPPEADSIECH